MNREVVLAMLLVALSALPAGAQPMTDPLRGQLLYATHCNACHGESMHWREKKIAKDWASLRAEVRRWQGVANLGWSEQEIEDVAQYLNTLYYHYPTPG